MVVNRTIIFLSMIACVLFGAAPLRSSAAAVTYSYDALNRLTNVNYGNGSVISYTYDAAGNRLTYSGPVTSDATDPTIAITSPTSGPSFTISNAIINLSGTASDNTGVTLITWENMSGGIGTASGTTNWSVNGIPLQPGTNDIYVTAYDAAGNITDAALTVIYYPPPPIHITGLTMVSNSTTALLAGVGPASALTLIQTSTNLINWQSIAVLTNTTGAFQFPYPVSKSESKRFFRALPPSVVPASPQLTGMGSSPGPFRFSVNGLWGDYYVVQASTNLTNWISISTNLIPPSGFVVITDPYATNYSRRFYRVVPGNAPSTLPNNMSLIPAGSFTMGDALDSDGGALPLHSVSVSAFYMDNYEVTKALWDDVYQWAISHGYSFDNSGLGKASTHPVQTVSWYDCVKWCNARSEKEGRTPAYYTSATQTTIYTNGQVDLQEGFVKWNTGYRLPTEAEWEKGARGGASGQRFPWGNTISWSQANYLANGNGYDINPTSGYHPAFNDGVYPYTSPPGYFAANGYGLYDMAGNVWQWCWDLSGSYSSGSQIDPHGPSTGSFRRNRGGSAHDFATYARTSFRNGNNPVSVAGNLGFRCVLTANQ